MKIRYTLHALERMRQRKIDRSLVEDCLLHPDMITSWDDIHRCVKRINDKVIVVIYRKEGENIIVITCFKSSKIQKYIK